MGQEREVWERNYEHRYGVPPDPERFAVPSSPAIGSVFGAVARAFTDPETASMVRQVKRTLDGAAERPPMPIETRIWHGVVWALALGLPVAALLHKNAMLPQRAAPKPAPSVWDLAEQERERQAAAAPVQRRKAPQVTVRHE